MSTRSLEGRNGPYSVVGSLPEAHALFCRRRHQPRRPPLQLAIAVLRQKRVTLEDQHACKLVVDQERELSNGVLTTATPR
jgi:hypothetical protein